MKLEITCDSGKSEILFAKDIKVFIDGREEAGLTGLSFVANANNPIAYLKLERGFKIDFIEKIENLLRWIKRQGAK
jgi:hypothetical protein